MTRNAWIIAALTALGLVLVLQEVQIVAMREMHIWLETVRLVGQPGSTEQYVTRWLGRPQQTMTPGEALRLISATGTEPTIPTGTRKVLGYERGWDVYYFIGRRGQVLGYVVRTS